MITTTFKSTVFGNSYDDLLDMAREEIATLLQIDKSEALENIRCEMIITPAAGDTYEAELIARIK
jgi:2-keto-3-deoxy-L-rhamnonate aldolase RhmA